MLLWTPHFVRIRKFSQPPCLYLPPCTRQKRVSDMDFFTFSWLVWFHTENRVQLPQQRQIQDYWAMLLVRNLSLFLFWTLSLRDGFLLFILVRPSVRWSVRLSLNIWDCSLVFSETLHEVRGQESRGSDMVVISKNILIRGLRGIKY